MLNDLHSQNVAMPMVDMAKGSLQELILRGELRLDEPMNQHTSWRVGGKARRFYKPADLQDLADFLRTLATHESVHVVGLGSNLLVRDGGISGTVVALYGQLDDLRIMGGNESNGLIYAGAGVTCAKLARFAAKNGLVGMEFFAGIPGTVGGALAMNAGCFAEETWKKVECVQIIHRSGRIYCREASDYDIGYRSVKLRHEDKQEYDSEWFVGGYFRLLRGNTVESQQKIKYLLAQRINSQPLNQPNAGSVFRNPPNDYAARLIESCGLKGKAIGGAMVSIKHANFIINTDNARAADIEALIQFIQKEVKKKSGIELVCEVHIMGEFGEHT
ncbi:UDP-N-acetylmuramate dehydrogenase [Nitrosomonas sp. PY1]|uniref:UDP-N-acetylmuramate dehydrogenase n=1 Tax=Nitrosomonas sp. PY1 TaxID=1803906 RepID=UPI001FC8A6C4|nr:UDP-N-acetylmuramate dehydrogenase [Nitrosomonas sp. PY1]GKS68134.1 UDP-N-acetylmuramate dehydrogenase [Nitrosomonas sp. PY1]